MADTTIQARRTYYAGVYFRSRTEARWAVFFDTLGLRWEYEPETYILDDLDYAPDFFLPDVGCFVEIKGVKPNQTEKDKARKLVDAFGMPVYIFTGDFTVPITDRTPGAWAFMQCKDPFNPDWHGVNEDDYYFWCECPNCGMYGIHYQGRSDRLPCSCEKSIDGDRGINTDSPSLVMAYEAARGFIFEYKQSA
ncbi:MAG TPA: hypothetical protein PLP86_05610 [Armatimonadota bacterium]|nr:hypothetical protein [Armatimonadota bacterium]